MTRRIAAGALIVACAAIAAIPEMTGSGIPLFRRDARAIQIFVSTTVIPGATNADNRVVITGSSDPIKAIDAAATQWSGVSTAAIGFLPVQTGAYRNDPSDGKFVLTIEDTAENRSLAGSFLAVAVYRFDPDGGIADSDVILNPNPTVGGSFAPASTDRSTGSFDLQSLIAHELGHTLGSSHSPVVGATMFQTQGLFTQFITPAEATVHQTLSADDIAFATTRYPASGARDLGSITGKVAYSSGDPIRGALVVAVAPASGVTIGVLSSLSDGSYRIDSVPPGAYLVYAQPANGPLTLANINSVPNLAQANTNFRTTFAGGNGTPLSIPVAAGQGASADIPVDPAPPEMHLDAIGTGSVGGGDWSTFFVNGSPGGRAIDVLIWGRGLNSSITADQIRFLGPGFSMRPASLRVQNAVLNGLPALRFTADLTVSPANVPVTIAVIQGTDAAIYSGGFIVMGGATACSYAVTPKLLSLPSSGGDGAVTVTAGNGCPWSASGGASWLHLTSVSAPAGNGSVSVSVDSNPGGARSDVLTVAGQGVTVEQAAGAPVTSRPVIARVVNGASFLPEIAAASWVTIQGTNLSGASPGRIWRANEIVGGQLPTSLDGVTVSIGGRAAYVYYISPTQINVQAPSGVLPGSVDVVVTNNGATSAAASARFQTYAPGLFLYGGARYAIVTRYPDNALIGNPALIPGTVAAAPKDVLILWVTGLGPTNPAAPAGQIVTGAPATTTLPTVTVGGRPAAVIGAALSPGSAGLYQIAIQLPEGLPPGDAEIRVSAGNVTSAVDVMIFVRAGS